MEFSYATRQKYEEELLAKWERKNAVKKRRLSKELSVLVKDIEEFGSYKSTAANIENFWRKHKNTGLSGAFNQQGMSLSERIFGNNIWKKSSQKKTVNEEAITVKNSNTAEYKLSDFMKRYCAPLVELYVPKEFIEDYYYIIDKLPNFQYTTGVSRRTIRTRKPDVHIKHAFMLLYSYRAFDCFQVTMEDYLMDKMSPEALDYKNYGYYKKLGINYFDEMLAARIDAGNQKMIELIREAFLSENNTVIVTTQLVRGVIKSDNAELHELLARFLVAARLQEGVRQVICENADCGTPEAFLVLLDAIKRENLIRFAAVKRAIATWTGLFDSENIERITDKVFDDICISVNDLDTATRMTETNDSIHIMIGLWALGFYEVEDALSVMERLADIGSRNQILTISYYNRMVQDKELTQRISTQIFEKYADDYEILAAFMPTFMAYTHSMMNNAIETKNGRYFHDKNSEYIYKPIAVTELFHNGTEARKIYGILKQAFQGMKKKKQEFFPCIFPWYGVTLLRSDFILRMVLVAYALGDQSMTDEVCVLLSEIDANSGYRWKAVQLLLHAPKTDVQRTALFSYITDKESYTRQAANTILKDMSLTDEEYMQMEGYLKYKTAEIREFVIGLLEKRNDDALKNSVTRLLSSNVENIRLAGFDLVKTRCDKSPKKREFYAAWIKDSGLEQDTLSEQEKILFQEITGGSAGELLGKDGYGLYHPDVHITLADKKPDMGVLADFFSLSAKEIDGMFDDLCAFIKQHEKDAYENCSGETILLGNGLYMTVSNYHLPMDQSYPFPELWKAFYENYIKTPKRFWNMYMARTTGHFSSKIKSFNEYLKVEKKLFYGCSSDYNIVNKQYPDSIRDTVETNRMIGIILGIIKCQQNLKLPREVAVNACLYAAGLPENKRWYERIQDNRYIDFSQDTTVSFCQTDKFKTLIGPVENWDNDKDFAESFDLLYRLDKAYEYQVVQRSLKSSYGRNRQGNYLSMFDYIKAYVLGLIPVDLVYQNAFETLQLPLAMSQLSCFVKEKLYVRDLNELSKYMQVDKEKKTLDKEDPFYQAGVKVYTNIVNLILEVELKRGDSPTVFSDSIMKITCIYGIDRLVSVLTALGKETLDRSTYYDWSSGMGKRECFSHLLQVCYPTSEDTADKLAEEVKKRKISEERLIETAMYAPQWIDLIEEYLGCDGFKSGCYYFMAHMNEQFDDKKKAMIAKYTPLTAEELNDGCFDVNWFFEAYEKLGDKMFAKLYKSAKYISDGSKHSRARKYADAALGKVQRDELEKTINEKRNKDLLMSYGLIPVVDEADELHRYEYLQGFLKESKQFGAQRKTSEAKCVSVALKNLATRAGYTDDMRLILAMETALVTSNAAYFEGMKVGDYTCKIIISIQGKAELEICKDEKKLKSVPAGIKKDVQFLAIKEFTAKLKNQYSRCVRMFEKSMEEREYYTLGELKKLCVNPVTKALLMNLVYVTATLEEKQSTDNAASETAGKQEDYKAVRFGILSEDGAFLDVKGQQIDLKEDGRLRLAHPYDLYAAGCWADWQKFFFERQQNIGIKQPFKQVFRELYVKLSEEKDADKSRMFAGNQIQPAKTVGALKNRSWVADYENGLQKIYYKDNIIATIYAMADWFSPADTEAPTLEYVVFYDRKTFRQLKLSEVPDIIYSEVMRDTDLAVSTAHVGGVDPLTSHSTIEMRKVIVKFNLELFKLENVTLEGSHGFVKGTYGEYSIHLGSGVIHQIGGHQINVLPVHSQKRGKIFLPFVDDDPKTAEIMSKILLFAQDQKIKDPYIMEQIIRS